MSWKKTIQTIPEKKQSSWKNTIQEIKQSPSELESGLRGLAQGASFGFADELTGGLESLYDVATTDKELEDLADMYKQNRDESRHAYSDAKEANPYAYGAGEIGGAIATSLIPGLNVAKGASLAGRVAGASGLSAVAGLGSSEADNLSDLAKDTAIAGGMGAAFQYGGEKILAPAMRKGSELLKKGASKASDYIDDVALPKMGKGLFGVDEKATANYLQNRTSVNKSYKLGELADSVLNPEAEDSVLNEMKQKISNLSSEDWKNLGRNTEIDKETLLSLGDDYANSILKGRDGSLTRTSAGGADGDALKAIYKELDAIQNGYGSSISEADLKSIISSLQNKSYGSDTHSSDKVKQLSGMFNDVLKTRNSNYAESVGKTADVTKSLKEVQRVFQNRLNPESYDKFNNAVKNLINKDEMSSANKAVEKIKEHTGYDLKKDIIDSWTNSQFQKGDINGSRKTVLGGIVGNTVMPGTGAGVAGPIGAAVGASVGFTADKFAGPIFKQILNGRLNASEGIQKIAPSLGKYAKPLLDAASRGNHSLAATTFVLQQQDPEFRIMMKKMNGEEQ